MVTWARSFRWGNARRVSNLSENRQSIFAIDGILVPWLIVIQSPSLSRLVRYAEAAVSAANLQNYLVHLTVTIGCALFLFRTIAGRLMLPLAVATVDAPVGFGVQAVKCHVFLKFRIFLYLPTVWVYPSVKWPLVPSKNHSVTVVVEFLGHWSISFQTSGISPSLCTRTGKWNIN